MLLLCLQIQIVDEQHRPLGSSRPFSAPAPSTSVVHQAYGSTVLTGAPNLITSILPASTSATALSTQSADLSLNISGFSASGGCSLFGEAGFTAPGTPRDIETPTQDKEWLSDSVIQWLSDTSDYQYYFQSDSGYFILQLQCIQFPCYIK